MSNIYIQEPPTSGKVLLKTTAGDIDVELWAREAPKTCRNFIQLCLEGYYNGTIFHRVIKGFIAQGGDPNGDGTGGESIYGEPFKDEFHSRLRFTRRGLVASANGGGKDDNASQFFFTLGEAMELQNKHTIFGKITGDTIFNMLKLEDADIDANERPLYPYKIVKTEVLLNPFDDIVPRQMVGREKDGSEKSKKKKKDKGVKNFGLLSFGAEAEEDEEQSDIFVQKNAGKAKSTHDILDDPKLSKQSVQVTAGTDPDDRIEIAERNASDDDGTLEEKAEKVRAKLKSSKRKVPNESKTEIEPNTPPLESKRKIAEVLAGDSDSDDFTNELEKERRAKRKKEADAIRDEIKALKKEYKNDRKTKDETAVAEEKSLKEKEPQNDMVEAYLSEQRKYSNLKKDVPKKGDQREQFTLQLLKNFKSKLANIRSEVPEASTSEATKKAVVDDEEDLNSDTWLTHTLRFEEQGEVLAKDASTKKDDWYSNDVNDPRNPINKRKRGEEDRRRDRDRTSRTSNSNSSSSRHRR